MSNKVWFITGSSRGLGLELAKAVLAAGHRLVATARNPQSISGLVEQYGDRVRAVELDVTSSQSVRAAVAAALAAFGRLDVVVNNAGYANVNSIEDVAEADFRAQVETNFFGVVEKPSVERIAEELGMSPRTLQRRLGELGATYQGLLDGVRRDTSRRLLADTDLDASEVAFLVGFEEVHSFSRAFHGWEGVTPNRWRGGQGAEAPNARGN